MTTTIIWEAFFMRPIKYLLILCTFSLRAQTFEIDTISYNGDDRINMVFLSDGYTVQQLDTFINDVKFYAKEIFKISPYNIYKDYFNIIAIKVPSLESGAKHPGGYNDCPPSMPKLNPNNYFGSSFDRGVHRGLATNTDIVFTVLANNFPNYDIKTMIVNTPYYGATGGSISVFGNRSDPGVMAHELGHTLGDLGDEYFMSSGEDEYPNKTSESNPSKVKWKSWIFSGSGISVIPLGGGSRYYIPSSKCKMSNSNLDYCSVCKESIIENIHNLFSPVLDMNPKENTIQTIDSTLLFSFTVLQNNPNSFKTIWKFDSTIVDKRPFNDSLFLNRHLLPKGYHYLTVTIQDTIQYSKVHLLYPNLHRTIIKWILKINEDQNSMIIQPKLFETNISVFPNPSGDRNILNYNFNSTNEKLLKITLSDLNGKIVSEISVLDNKLDISGLQDGLYIVTFITNEKKTDLKLQIIR